MDSLNLELWQMAIAGVLYMAYLCWVMFGGLRKKRIKPVVYIVMTALMLYGVITEFDGVKNLAEIIDLCVILLIGLVKGVYLGKKKIVERVDGKWYIRHDKKYIIAWALFFALKMLLTQVLKYITGAKMPLWHMILYFCFYYPWSTVNVFIANPEMRREVLQKR